MDYRFILESSPPTFQAFGTHLEGLFVHAGQALVHILCEKKVKNIKTKKIHVHGKDRKELLYNFLEEIMYLYDVGGFLISDIPTLTISGTPKIQGIKKYYHLELRADVLGDDAVYYPVDSRVHVVLDKKMSINEELTQNGKKFIAHVFFKKIYNH